MKNMKYIKPELYKPGERSSKLIDLRRPGFISLVLAAFLQSDPQCGRGWSE